MAASRAIDLLAKFRPPTSAGGLSARLLAIKSSFIPFPLGVSIPSRLEDLQMAARLVETVRPFFLVHRCRRQVVGEWYVLSYPISASDIHRLITKGLKGAFSRVEKPLLLLQRRSIKALIFIWEHIIA